MSPDEVMAVFVGMNLPLVERGIDEVQAAKDRLVGFGQLPSGGSEVVQRMIVSNGTGERNKAKNKNAELERRSF